MERKLRISSIVMLSAVCVVLIAVLVIGTVSGGFGFLGTTGLAQGGAVEVERQTVALEDVDAMLVETTNIKFNIYTGSEGDSAQVVLYSNLGDNCSQLDIKETGTRVEISTQADRHLVLTGMISEHID
ncbi:MAG: hypothetical protein LIO46_01135, partial [Clostridiales bacterium]|nr:hypothetical protein [Clostridiales bacterium]